MVKVSRLDSICTLRCVPVTDTSIEELLISLKSDLKDREILYFEREAPQLLLWALEPLEALEYIN